MTLLFDFIQIRTFFVPSIAHTTLLLSEIMGNISSAMTFFMTFKDNTTMILSKYGQNSLEKGFNCIESK